MRLLASFGFPGAPQRRLSPGEVSALPQPPLPSPARLISWRRGTFALLSKRLGKKGAQELIAKNPGVLICTPRSLENESNESILRAADFVDSVERNKPAIRVAAGTVGTVFLALVVYGIAAKNSGADWLELYWQDVLSKYSAL